MSKIARSFFIDVDHGFASNYKFVANKTSIRNIRDYLTVRQSFKPVNFCEGCRAIKNWLKTGQFEPPFCFEFGFTTHFTKSEFQLLIDELEQTGNTDAMQKLLELEDTVMDDEVLDLRRRQYIHKSLNIELVEKIFKSFENISKSTGYKFLGRHWYFSKLNAILSAEPILREEINLNVNDKEELVLEVIEFTFARRFEYDDEFLPIDDHFVITLLIPVALSDSDNNDHRAYAILDMHADSSDNGTLTKIIEDNLVVAKVKVFLK